MTQAKAFRFTNYQGYAEELRKQLPEKEGLEQILYHGFNLFEGSLSLHYAVQGGDNITLIKEGLTKCFTSLGSYLEMAIPKLDLKHNVYAAIEEVLWHPQYTITLPKEEMLVFYGSMLELSKQIDHAKENNGEFPAGHNTFINRQFPGMFRNLVSICLHYSFPPLEVLHAGLKDE